jgi:FlaA1/EpsC-like NDP-sugar epimerase
MKAGFTRRNVRVTAAVAAILLTLSFVPEFHFWSHVGAGELQWIIPSLVALILVVFVLPAIFLAMFEDAITSVLILCALISALFIFAECV